MRVFGFRKPSLALEPYERPVMRNAFHCPPGKHTGIAVGIFTAVAATTNGLLPLLTGNEALLPWLGVNDMLLCGMVSAAVVTIKTETAVPGVKERLSQPGVFIADTREEPLDDWTGQCERCSVTTPFRAYHCCQCQKCVDQFDHHCSILGVCVGKANHRAFIAALVSALLYLFSTLALTIAAICMAAGADIDVGMSKTVWMGLMHLTAFMTTGPIGILIRLASWQIRAALLGVTQFEWFQLRSIARAEREEAAHVAEAEKRAEEAKKERAIQAQKEAEAEADAIAAYYASLAIPEIVVVE